MMTMFLPSPGTARGPFAATACLLAVLGAEGAQAQGASAAPQRKSMEFGVVPSDPRPAALPAPQDQAADPAAPHLQAPLQAETATPQPASAAGGMPAVQAGLLECRGAFAAAYGFGSTRKVTCEFRPSTGEVHYYVGTLDRVGLDIGISDQGSMLWGVLATSPDLRPGALAGRYVGVTSGFALGPGFSANMLASADASRQVTLQPVSVSADSGLSLSIAGASLTLEPSATRPR